MSKHRKAARISEELIARFLKDLREDLLPTPKMRPKPKISAEVLMFPPILSEQRRHQVIDAIWERVQAERQKLER